MPTFERRLDARLVLAVVAVGIMSFAGVVVETAMNIAFPALMKEFGVSTSTVQWITTGYLLVLAAIMPISSFSTGACAPGPCSPWPWRPS